MNGQPCSAKTGALFGNPGFLWARLPFALPLGRCRRLLRGAAGCAWVFARRNASFGRKNGTCNLVGKMEGKIIIGLQCETVICNLTYFRFRGIIILW